MSSCVDSTQCPNQMNSRTADPGFRSRRPANASGERGLYQVVVGMARFFSSWRVWSWCVNSTHDRPTEARRRFRGSLTATMRAKALRAIVCRLDTRLGSRRFNDSCADLRDGLSTRQLQMQSGRTRHFHSRRPPTALTLPMCRLDTRSHDLSHKKKKPAKAGFHSHQQSQSSISLALR